MAATSHPAVPIWLPFAVLALLIAWPAAGRAGGVDRAGGEHVELVVADLRANQLLLVDLAAGSIADEIALPGGAHELIELPDGRIVVSIEQRGELAVVDLDTGGVEVVTTGGVPHGLALDGGVLLVTDRAAGAIRRFEVDGWRELSPIEAGRWPHAVAVMAGGELAVASALDGMLRIGDRVREVTALPETVSVANDGAVATAGAIGGDLQVFDAAGSEELRVALGGRPVRVLFAPDGRSIAVALSASGEVALVDRSGAVRRVSVPGVPDGLAFNGAGDRLYVSDLVHGGVAVLDPAAATLIGVIEGGTATGALLVR